MLSWWHTVRILLESIQCANQPRSCGAQIQWALPLATAASDKQS